MGDILVTYYNELNQLLRSKQNSSYVPVSFGSYFPYIYYQ